MKFLKLTGFALAGVALSLSGHAAIDGSKPFVCVPRVAHECDAGGCVTVTPEDIGLGSFTRVDLKKKRIETIGADRMTPIEYMETPEDGGWVIGGVDGIHGWSVTIADESGEMTETISGPGIAFVLYGICAQF